MSKTFLEQAKEELHDVLYCCYCLEPKNDKIVCCDEFHFIEFKYFDDDAQNEIIKAEYDLNRN